MADEVYKPGGLSPEDRLLLNNFRGIPIDDEPVYEEDEPIYEEADPISDNIGLGATTPEASKMFYEFSEGFELPLESADPPDQFERWLENRDSLYNNAINEGLNEKEALARSRIEANASMLMGVFGEFDLEKSESPGDGPIAAGGRVFSRRIASVQPREEGVSTTEQRFEDTRKEAQRMQLIIDKEGLFPAAASTHPLLVCALSPADGHRFDPDRRHRSGLGLITTTTQKATTLSRLLTATVPGRRLRIGRRRTRSACGRRPLPPRDDLPCFISCVNSI